jgi:lipoprotein-releasing system permease protein
MRRNDFRASDRHALSARSAQAGCNFRHYFHCILGVAAGVAALVVAMAVSAGQREDIQERLFGAQAHISIFPAGPERMLNYQDLVKQIEQVDGVVAAAPHRAQFMAIKRQQLTPVMVKGVVPEMEDRLSDLSHHMVSGHYEDLKDNTILVGKAVGRRPGVKIGDPLTIYSGTGNVGALGISTSIVQFTVVGIYSIGCSNTIHSLSTFLSRERRS